MQDGSRTMDIDREPNKKNLRINRILDKLKAEKVVTIKDLSDSFEVTKMTIYRDINILQDMQIAMVTNGVVIFNETETRGKEQDRKDISYDLPTEIHRNVEAKKRIAQKAAELIEPEDIIYIDSGSTMEYLSRVIPEDMNIVVGCHAFYVLMNIQMKKKCDIIFSGGSFHKDTQVFESEETVNMLHRIRINKAFFAAGGVSARLGVTYSNPFVLNIKRAVLESSKEKILLVDSSKFEAVKKVYYANLKEFDLIITDDKISEVYRMIIEKLGIRLCIV